MTNQQIGINKIKTNFSNIIKKVENGEEFIITRWGKPVAKIIPFEQGKKMTRKEAIDGFRELRKLYRGVPGDFNIREAIEEGRK